MLVDDDPLVRRGLTLLFELGSEFVVTNEADDGSDVLATLAASPVDVLLMDVQMKRTSGLVTASNVRRRYPHMRIVLMSSFADEKFITHALNAGADDFVVKSSPMKVFFTALKPTWREADPAPATGVSGRNLTARELYVATCVAKGMSTENIAVDMNVSPSTVKTYISRVYTKLDLHNRVQLANFINTSS